MKKNTSSGKTNSKNKKRAKNKKSRLHLVLFVLLVAVVFAFAYKKGYVYVDFEEDGTPVFALNLPSGFEDESAGAKTVALTSAENPVQTPEASGTSVSVNSNKPLDESAVPLGEENSSLYFGNPSGAVKDVKASSNYLLEHPQYVMSYNAEKFIPNWVSWHLAVSDIGDSARADDFRPDSDIQNIWYAVKKADYQFNKYGFDRGHVCPSADRTSTEQNNSMTFLMTNMIPQSPDCNRVVWKDLESYERELVKSGKEVYIIAGPHGVGGESKTGQWNYIEMSNGKKIEVPAYCWKIILVLDEGEKDIERVTKETPVIAVYMPNAMGIGKKGSWEQFLVSVDYIEEKTGYDFLAPIPDSIENYIEQKVYSK